MSLGTSLSVNDAGHLTFAGLDTVSLASKYGTPLFLYDGDVIRKNIRFYRDASRLFQNRMLPFYAMKAFACKAIAKICAEEGIGIDCVSGGELYTAASAGFPAGQICFHGNNKTREELRLALNLSVGYIVVDNEEELETLEEEAAASPSPSGKKQNILLRITPGIDPHTNKKISTGQVDSKFGSQIGTGAAMRIVRKALACRHLEVAGLHCHIGSQIFDASPFCDAADVMIGFLGEIRKETGVTFPVLNLGGGFGVRYTEQDPPIDHTGILTRLSHTLSESAARIQYPLPQIFLEPGRSIVAEAGLTLYTVGSVKELPGFRTYVSVDGGMTDNPRYTLYGAKYTAVAANRAKEPPSCRVTLSGRCCESGDLIGENLALQPVRPGDLVAVLTTGAYHYSMASNYNRLPRPPVLLIQNREARVIIRRETYDDIIRNDLL